MAGILYLVSTPIGNLGDLSGRAAETLAAADFIAAEDTRVTVKLLNHLGLKKPMMAYHRHNAGAAGPAILARLLAGESCALVTDAGSPAVSDPGEDLVVLCARAGVSVTAVPGACALVAALSVSALPTARFVFEGFLPTNKKNRRERLAALAAETRTAVLYEAPHKLLGTLEDLAEALGADRRVSLCRELTKLHEEVLRTTLAGALERFRAQAPRGEFVLVLEGARPAPPAAQAPEEALRLVSDLRAQGLSLKEAAAQAAQETGVRKRILYDLALGKSRKN